MTTQFSRMLGLSAALALTSCGGGGGGGMASAPPPPPPPTNSTFQTIQNTIFTPICSGCHAGANAPQGLRLDAANSFALLVNVASAEVPGLLRVNPGNPGQSYLVQKIEGTAAVGVRMPANGPPFLTQAQIDLVKSWISAGAPQSAAPPNALLVVSTIPAVSEHAAAGTQKLTIVFNSEVDSSRVDDNSFVLRDASDQVVALASARVPSGRQNVVELTTRRPLAAGSYQLSVLGDGPAPLADQSGRVLDGDADGKPGGDAVVPFDVGVGAAR